ncbi:DUF3616 domain-containing protein [Bradyrhizobium japonicum]|uniref:DUF3616 domain-containing protein n=1 Tax=Bradyrhizobium japonicum TaxID=375 RepID=UPI001BAB3EF8|nr:DUF3616 domain-containing protein [Bradyrhizobium japonicum]MBR0911463.1 DUF3616 domain-containing protein [Bradyrhizobium japonicum]
MSVSRFSRFAMITLLPSLVAGVSHAQKVTTYRGICDASAAIALGKDHFVVGDDELNVIRVYKRGQPDAVKQIDLSSLLGTKPDKESDIEGAALIGNRIFWISSHGTNKDGEVQDRRRRLFATDLVDGETPTVRGVKKPYTKLVDDLSTDPRLLKYDLATAATKPPKTPDALNIEGLADTPEGGLLIGFRNPIPGGKALIVPLTNPNEAVSGAARAKLGDPVEIKLEGRGVRSLERVGTSYLIVAGPIDGGGPFDLYRWSGKAEEDPKKVPGVDLAHLNPEALFAIPGAPEVQILSDDGSEKIGGKECKKLPREAQSFRSVTVKP